MPSNIFATTGTNVSVIFIDKKPEDDFSVALSYDEIRDKNYSLAAGYCFGID